MLAAKRGRLLGLAIFILMAAACGTDASTSEVSTAISSTTIQAPQSAYEPSNPDAVAAVEGFLSAEVAGDFVSSFEFLSADDQNQTGGVESWVSEHYFLLPVVTGFTVTGDGFDGLIQSIPRCRLLEV